MEGTARDPSFGVEAATGQLRHVAFEDFYRVKHAPVFQALALTLRDRTLASEAADEAMARTYQHWRTVAGHTNQAGWAYVVGLNWARGRLRRRRREILTSSPPDIAAEVSLPNPDLDRALSSLDLQSRALIIMRYFYDWSYEEISNAVHLPLGTVKSRLHRLLSEMRIQMETKT
jgi:RNA polymerase sigma-70 factor (ECF subfamily)